MRVEAETVLPATPAEAWATLTDWEHQVGWMRDADSVRVLTSYREGVGVRIAVKTRVLNVPLFTEVLEVTEWRPFDRLVARHLGFVSGVGTWTLAPAPSGTRFRWTEDLSMPVPLVGALVLGIYRPLMRRLMRAALRDLGGSLARRDHG